MCNVLITIAALYVADALQNIPLFRFNPLPSIWTTNYISHWEKHTDSFYHY